MINSVLLICICILGCFLQGSFIYAEHNKRYVLATVLKGSSSVVFVALGVLCSGISTEPVLAKRIVFGLAFGAVGDVLHALRFVFPKRTMEYFIGGMIVFWFGHFFYLWALIPLSQKPVVWAIAAIVADGVLCFVILRTLKNIDSYYVAFGTIYLTTIVVMVVYAIGNFLEAPTNVHASVYAIGAVLFIASDIMLAYNKFGPKKSFPMRIGNLSLYYIGQLLIAVSIALY